MAHRHPQRRRSPWCRRRPGVGVGRLNGSRPLPQHSAGGERGDAALHSASALDHGPVPVRPTPAPDRRSAAEPVRTCVGCRTRSQAGGLLRVVAVDGVVTPDPRRRLPGRGAWLHPVLECLDRAERRSAFPRALRVPGPLDVTAVRAHLTVASGAQETPASVTAGSKVDPS
ncbi:YlxR family protein [Pseudonocardia sp.]|uniref:YlxR family protein n=1 Tax=Pseudonocardia sp. TaxID=60912 RepID=UPI002601EA64|nr:YlxR family protein [Pseudonocardia sp.]